MKKTLLSKKELAQLLQVSVRTVERLARKRNIARIRLDRRTCFQETDVPRFL